MKKFFQKLNSTWNCYSCCWPWEYCVIINLTRKPNIHQPTIPITYVGCYHLRLNLFLNLILTVNTSFNICYWFDIFELARGTCTSPFELSNRMCVGFFFWIEIKFKLRGEFMCVVSKQIWCTKTDLSLTSYRHGHCRCWTKWIWGTYNQNQDYV